MKKLFRFHRGSLAESLDTTIEVSGLSDIQKVVSESVEYCGVPYYKNIRIDNKAHSDPRLPEEWNGVSHYVIADFDGYEGQCLGMSNFYEE